MDQILLDPEPKTSRCCSRSPKIEMPETGARNLSLGSTALLLIRGSLCAFHPLEAWNVLYAVLSGTQTSVTTVYCLRAVWMSQFSKTLRVLLSCTVGNSVWFVDWDSQSRMMWNLPESLRHVTDVVTCRFHGLKPCNVTFLCHSFKRLWYGFVPKRKALHWN